MAPLSEIDWENGPYYLQFEMDATGGTNYQLMGTSQLLSVPYALYAATTGDAGATEINELNDGKTAGNNLFLGLDTGANDDGTDNQNVALGRNALNANISGSWNTANGFRALYSNTTGNYNVAYGHASNLFNQEGSKNTMIGYSAGRGIDTHNKSENVFLGFQAGYSAITGSDANIFVGFKAGYNETGSNKLYIENSDSESPLIYGEFDTDLVRINGDLDVTGSFLSIGIDDLSDGRTIGESVFLGQDAGEKDDGTDNHNVAVGFKALSNNTSGFFNTAMGYHALWFHETGRDNTAIGVSALAFNTGSYNTAIGAAAGTKNTIGENNTVVGNGANYWNQEGVNNTIIGYKAGANYQTHSKSGNVFIGYRAGYYETDNDRLYIENSNTTTPLIYGEFDNDILAFNAKVGIGTTTPEFNLDVRSGSTDLTSRIGLSNSDNSKQLHFSSGNDTYDPHISFSGGGVLRFMQLDEGYNELMRITGDGNVGIGTTNPEESALLDLNSNSKGFLPPRMTQDEIVALESPADGLMVYNTDDKRFYFFDGGDELWKEIALGTSTLNTNCGTVSDNEGNTYNTIVIGSQCWMAENLATTKFRDGSDVPLVTNSNTWEDLDGSPAYCWFNNDSATYASTYGALYNWWAAEGGGSSNPKLCPDGWHLPTWEDIHTLRDYLGGEEVAGGKLKEAGYEHWNFPNTDATNESGFKGLPGSTRVSYGGQFGLIGQLGYWWTDWEYNGGNDDDIQDAWRYTLHYDYSFLYEFPIDKNNGCSVRCIKD